MSPDRQPSLTPQAVLGVIIALLGVIFTLDNLGLANADVALRYWPSGPRRRGRGDLHARRADPRLDLRRAVDGRRLTAPGAEPGVDYRAAQEAAAAPARRAGRTTHLAASAEAASRHAATHPGDARRFGDPGRAPSIAPGPARARPGRSPANPPRPSRARAEAPPPAGTGRRRCGRSSARRTAASDVFAILGGVERRLRSEVFTGAELTAIMGGCELDLREARMGGDEAHIARSRLWGGIEIRVPREWLVLNESSALMGGVDDATRPHPGAEPSATRGPRIRADGGDRDQELSSATATGCGHIGSVCRGVAAP